MRVHSTSSLLAAVLAGSWLSGAACDPKPESTTAATETTLVAPSPTPVPPDPTPAPAPPDDEPIPDFVVPESQGVSIDVKVGAETTTLELSKAILQARDKGPIATWDCNAHLGSVGVVDFVIGDDPAKKGELFVMRIDRSGFSRLVPGQTSRARIQMRRAGESAVTAIDATATWNSDLLSGVAKGQTPDGLDIEARWTCAPSPKP